MKRSACFGLLIGALLAPASSAQMYAADSDADQLLTLDTVTGVASVLGPTGGTGLDTPAGLAFVGADLWTIDLGGGELFTLDLVTGAPTLQGTTSVSGWQGLAADPTAGGQLYAINQSDELYMVSPTGTLSLITAGTPGLITGLEFDAAGQLWGTDFGGQLYQLDKVTGAATLVGPTQANIQGLTFRGSTMYGYSTGTDTLYTIDTMTGAATPVGGPSATLFVKGLAAIGPACSLTSPMSPASADVTLPIDTSSPASMTMDIGFDFSTDAGVTFAPCTAAATSPLSNPAVGVATGMATFIWDTLLDGVGTLVPAAGVLVRATANDGVSPVPATCLTTPFDVDNVPLPPTCTLTGPAGLAGDDVTTMLDSASPNSATVDIVFEFSLDGGATYSPCSAAATSPLPNPALGTATGMATFLWDSRIDGVGTASIAPGVLVRATLDDGVSPIMGTCETAPFDVDNTALCNGICGDCSEDGMGPTVLDALSAAQIAAGLFTPTSFQAACCDVDASMTVTIVDALFIAQDAAGLPVTLTCP